MARQVAVVVGVSTVPGLSFLAGVRPGVDDFESWALGQGFEVERCSDEDGKVPVSADDVFHVVRDAVRAGDVERLFIFFSGHGFAPGVGDDLWLCSGADSDPADAVNVAKSVALARSCGIGHVAFFADACRSPKTVSFNGLVGRPIFPLDRVIRPRPEVDQFYATISGDLAYDSVPQGGEKAFGIFTKFLLGALRGQQPSILEQVPNGLAPSALLSRRLAQFLNQTLPLESSRAIHITQTPDCIPTSTWEPNALAWFSGLPSTQLEIDPSEGWRDPLSEGPTQPGSQLESDSRPREYAGDLGYDDTDWRYPPSEGPSTDFEPVPQVESDGPWSRPRPTGEQAQRIESLADSFMAEPGRTHFETGVGASIIGAELRDAWMVAGEKQFFEEDGNWHVRGEPQQQGSLVTEVAPAGQESLWVATALFPGFVTTVTVNDEGADHVATISVLGDVDADRAALARADAAFQAGDLGFVNDAGVRRLLAEANPAMSVLAAYAFDRAGGQLEVLRIFEQFASVDWPMPFDVAMLADWPVPTMSHVAPSYPMMTRGWALADDLPAGDRWLRYGQRRLARTAWTTFTDLSIDAIDALLKPLDEDRTAQQTAHKAELAEQAPAAERAIGAVTSPEAEQENVREFELEDG